MRRLQKLVNKIDKKVAIIVSILVVLTMLPLIFQGIICNDELQTRYWRNLGLFDLIKHYFSIAADCGRTIGGLVDVRAISFLSRNMYYNRVIDVILILLCIGLFSYFVYQIYRNKHFSWFLGIMLMVCLPVTFEHGAPNAFVAITVIPFIFVIVSCLFFWKYLSESRKSYFVISMLLFTIAMMQYEFIVTYILLIYLLILKFEKEKTEFKSIDAIKKAVAPTLITILYIILYFIMQQVNVSGYSGTSIGFVSLKSSLKILYVLAKSSIPGYFLFNQKYKYLKLIYENDVENLIFIKVNIFLIVIALTSIIMLIIFDKKRNKSKISWLSMISAVIFMIIPSLPNAISSLYQGNVSESFFTWLPVSIFLYFSATFLISSIIWNVFQCLNKYIILLGGIALSIFIGQIQYMNYINANQQHNDFERLQTIENMFDMQIWEDFDGKDIYSEDVYQTKNLLAVHDMFWSQYFQKNGLKINVEKGKLENGLNLYFYKDEYFILAGTNAVIVCSDRELHGYNVIKSSDRRYIAVKFEQGEEDSGFYVYSYSMSEKNGKRIDLDAAIRLLTMNE